MVASSHGETCALVPKHDIVLVTRNGGILDHHSTLMLSPHAS